MWAASYWKGCRINVNMQLENLHMQLKHKHLEGKKTKRIDKFIIGLKKLLDERVEDRKEKLNRGKSGHRKT